MAEGSTELSVEERIALCRSYISLLDDDNTDDAKNETNMQFVNKNLQVVFSHAESPTIIHNMLDVFMRVLRRKNTSFISDHSLQKLRKLLLEIIHHVTICKYPDSQVADILNTLFELLKDENEENGLVCLRTIIDLHSACKSEFNEKQTTNSWQKLYEADSIKINSFLDFVSKLFSALSDEFNEIFKPRDALKLSDLYNEKSELNEQKLEHVLPRTYSVTDISTDAQKPRNLIPKTMMSFKVLAELPIVFALAHQLYRVRVFADIKNLMPHFIRMVTLEPPESYIKHPQFNRELFADFMAAKIKTLSFLIHIFCSDKDLLGCEEDIHQGIVVGMLLSFRLCPPEITHLRKELLIAAQYILSTSFRDKFIGSLDELFDEKILIGSGWTAREALRPSAYGMLADFVFQVRSQLSLDHLKKAVEVFSNIIHDETLSTSIQTMSCKLLLNLLECIGKYAESNDEVIPLAEGELSREQSPSRDEAYVSDSESSRGTNESSHKPKDNAMKEKANKLFLKMMEVFVLKCKTVAKVQLPILRIKSESATVPLAAAQQSENMNATNHDFQLETKEEKEPGNFLLNFLNGNKEDKKPKYEFPTQSGSYSVADCRVLVKTLVRGVKEITVAILEKGKKLPERDMQSKLLVSNKIVVFIQLSKYAFKAIDILSASFPTLNQYSPQSSGTSVSKDEKDALGNLAIVFTSLFDTTFKDVFSITIGNLVDYLCTNSALLIITNMFLSNCHTSKIFAEILLEYLLQRMHEIGGNTLRSNLYLELYKQIFRALSLFPIQNERVLKPYLQQIISQSMDLALTAKDPYNYLALLISLFDAIGKGNHELMFMDFLNMLPNLLEKFNHLLGRSHKPKYRELFIELCLAVPVTLSSWLPYLDKLMYPLLAAINSSQSLVIQGLSTLEVCAMSFQPLASECLEPVWPELMQTLWRLLRHEDPKISQVAFKVLGKFGGINREKVMVHPQPLQYNKEDNPLCISISFSSASMPESSISLPINKIIENAYNVLISEDAEDFYQEESWAVIKGFLSAMIDHSEDHVNNSFHFFSHANFNKKLKPVLLPLYKCPDEESRRITELALTGMLVAASKQKLKASVVPYASGLIHHYTILMVGQQCGVYVGGGKFLEHQGMDPLVLLDAIVSALRQGDEELCAAIKWALAFIWDTTTICIRSEIEACRLPFISYLVGEVLSLCYEGGFSPKLGGCIAIEFLSHRMPRVWVLSHLCRFVKALFFIIMDLTGDISVGTVDFAKSVLNELLPRFAMLDADSMDLQKLTIYEITNELIQFLTSHNASVRQQAIKSLELLASTTNKTIPMLLHEYKSIIDVFIPPEGYRLKKNPVPSQVGMLNAIIFCIKNLPSLLETGYDRHEHLLEDLQIICNLDKEADLREIPCYFSAVSLTALYEASFHLLSLYYIYFEYPTSALKNQQRIYALFYKGLCSSNTTAQKAAYQAVKELMHGGHISKEMVSLKEFSATDLSIEKIRCGSYLTELFDVPVNEECLNYLLQYLSDQIKTGDIKNNVELCSTIIKIFTKTSVIITYDIYDTILNLILGSEMHLILRPGLEEPILEFLSRYTQQTMKCFLDKAFLDNKNARFLVYLLKSDQGKSFRRYLMDNSNQLVFLLSNWFKSSNEASHSRSSSFNTVKMGKLYVALKIFSILIKYDEKWIAEEKNVCVNLKQVWKSESFVKCLSNMDLVDLVQWKVPKLLVKCLLNFFQNNTDEIMLLFNLLHIFTGRYLPGFEFLREFLQTTIAGSYPLQWKRKAFFEFVKVFRSYEYSQELKAKILQYIIIPCFSTTANGEDIFPHRDVALSERGLQRDPFEEVDIISIFISDVIGAETAPKCSDAVRILLLQLSCLLVEKALQPMQAMKDKEEEKKLRQLMIFAWPCLLTRNCVDPATKYHGHLLLAIIIVKFPIWEKIVLQVFHGLLKAHVPEVRTVVQQALEVLTPIIPHRIVDSNHKLSHWTKKVMVEDGGTLPRLVHLLHLLVRHYKVYKPIRHDLLPHMISSIKRIASMTNVQLEYKKLAIDVAEVIIHWELERLQEDPKDEPTGDKIKRKKSNSPSKSSGDGNVKGHQGTLGKSGKSEYKGKNTREPMEEIHADAIVNFLLRMACQINDASITSSGSPGEQLCQRCILLLKTTLEPNLWPNANLELSWFSELFKTLENQQPNYGNVCTALEFLKFYVSMNNKEAVLSTIRKLQPGLSGCMRNQNLKIIHAMHDLLSQLMITFPIIEYKGLFRSSVADLDALYADMDAFIINGLNSYEKSTKESTTLCGILLILKAACFQNLSFIDHLMDSFISMMLKLVKENLEPPAGDVVVVNTDLLIISLNLLTNRAGILRQDLMKDFINEILIVLIERCTEVKVLKLMVQIAEKWVSAADSKIIIPPPSGYVAVLFDKMVQCFTKNFPNEQELNIQFLKLVYRIYSEPELSSEEYQAVLEPAFLSGLYCIDPHVRSLFIAVDCGHLSCDPFKRLMSIVTSWNKNKIGNRFGIKHCLELMLNLSTGPSRISCSKLEVILPPMISILSEKELASSFCTDSLKNNLKENKVIDGSISWDDLSARYTCRNHKHWAAEINCQHLRFSYQIQFLRQLKEQKTSDFLKAVNQLCYTDTDLAEFLWIQLLPKIWKLLNENQQDVLQSEIVAFLYRAQPATKDIYPNPISVFAESFLLCKPLADISPDLLVNIGTSLNLWHRACLLLEKAPNEELASNHRIRMLLDLYGQLKEDDLFSAVCTQVCTCADFSAAIALENQGCFSEAKTKLEELEAENTSEFREIVQIVFEKQARCAEQLADWNDLRRLAEKENHPLLCFESYFRSRKWDLLKRALNEVEQTSPDNPAWKLNLLKGYLSVCHPVDKDLSLVDQQTNVLSNLCIREWKNLPSVVSHSHIPILQAAQQVTELKDAAEIHKYLEQQEFLYMRAIVKKWPDRLPALSDDFSYWTAVHSWRDVHTMDIARFDCMKMDEEEPYLYEQLGLMAFVNSNLTICTQARKQGDPELSLKGLLILGIEEADCIPPTSIFRKLKQMLKCHLAMSYAADSDTRNNHLLEGLKLINGATERFNFFESKDRSEITAMKGVFYSKLYEADHANRKFLEAIEMDNNQMKSWAMYGEFLEDLFMKRKSKDESEFEHGELAIVAYMNCCQLSKESMARKYLARTLWLLSFDDESYSLSKQFMEYSLLVAAHHWIPWLPQLIASIGRPEGVYYHHLLCHLGCKYPSAVYFPLRTLCESVKSERQILGFEYYLNNISRNIGFMQKVKPSAIYALERISLELMWFKESVFELMFRKLQDVLRMTFSRMYSMSSFNLCYPTLGDIMEKIKLLFCSEAKCKETIPIQDPVYRGMKEAFNNDFNFKINEPESLLNLIAMLKKWIKIFEARLKFLPKSFMLNKRCTFLSEFNQEMADLEIPGELLQPRTNVECVKIAQFMPKVDIVQKHGGVARRLYIRGHNGKIYPYLIVDHKSTLDTRSEERVLQLFRFVNTYLLKQKETLRRGLNLSVPRITSLSPYTQIVEDNISSLSFYDIYQKYCEKQKMDPDKPLLSCKPQLQSLMHQPPETIYANYEKMENIQKNMVPKTLFKNWALQTYPTATDYWTFRKQFTLQHSLVSFFEYCLYLNSLMPEMMYIHPETGNLTAFNFHFNLDDNGTFSSSMQPVPFRLTPNISEFVTETGILGPMCSTMIATARCLLQPKFQIQYILRAILKEELYDWHQKVYQEFDAPDINLVQDAVSAVGVRLQRLGEMNGAESTVKTLCSVATSRERQREMGVMWLPWL